MPEYTADRIAIKDLSCLYAIAVDRRDYELFESVITEDCLIKGPGVELQGIDQILEGMREIEHYKSTFHAVGNHIVTIEGDQAQGEVYCTASHIYDQDGVERKLDWGIRYQDQYRHTKNGWRLTVRELLVDWTQDLPTGA